MSATGSYPAAILLDALGTLVALEPPAPRLRAALASRFGLEVSHDEAARAIAAEIAYYRAHFDAGRDEASLRELRRRSAAVLPATPLFRAFPAFRSSERFVDLSPSTMPFIRISERVHHPAPPCVS